MPLNQPFPFYCANGGGKWFTCDSGTRFVGCCMRNPCQTGCAPEDRLPAYFNSSLWSEFPDQLCGGNDGLFYTCAMSGFLGCCRSNPCTNTISSGRCPYEDLGSATLSTDPEQVAYFTPENWNHTLDVNVFHQQLQNVSQTSTPASSRSLRNPFPTSITFALALISLITTASFATLVAALISYKRQKVADQRDSAICQESIPLTQTGSRPSSVERSPSVQSTYLQSSPVPAIQLTPPLSADPWHSHHLHSKGASNRISVTSSVLTKAINSTRQRPHKWAHVLIFLTCLVLTLVTTFLAVLWFSNKSPLWHYIMEHNYATRFITGSTLVVRIMVDLQACVAATMLAALFLESRDGVALAESVAISIMRYDTTPLTLALPVLRGWGQQRKRIAYGLLSALLLCLVATTMLLQLSSTILLMDLSIGSHPGLRHTRYLPLDFSYRCLSEHCNEVYLNQIPRISSWGMGPPSFPAFAELKSEADRSNPEIADTGVLLRAFPPYTDANTRENLQEYIGKALVIDARVSCQAPKIEDLVWTSPTYANFSGRITSRIPAPRLTEVAGTNFSCTYGNLNHLSLCQISNNPFQPYFGSLRCQFENNSVEEKTYVYDERPTTYGTAFLVIKAINGSEVPSSDSQLSADGITELIYQDEWLNLKKPMDDGSLAALSLSLCFAPWETARLPITMKSDQNRSEPRTTWQPPESVDSAGSFDMSQVLRQHGIGSYKHASSVDRGILNLTVPSYQVTEADDRRPRSQRPFVQTDTSEIGLSFGGANVPLASNWTIFLSGNILPSILTDFSYEPANVFAADPAVTNLFVSTLEQSDVAHAMASIITVLSATSYYNQMPAFDYAANVSEILFQSVLIPLSRSGYTAFVYVLATHVVVVAIVVALFKLQTKLSLVGESWAAVAPLLAASTRNDLDLMDGDDEKTFDEIREMLIDASGIDDERVVNRLRQRGVSGHAVRLEDGELTEDGETSLIFRVVH